MKRRRASRNVILVSVLGSKYEEFLRRPFQCSEPKGVTNYNASPFLKTFHFSASQPARCTHSQLECDARYYRQL